MLVLWYSQEADYLELYFQYFEEKVHYMNKTLYIDFHTYNKAKGAFILSEERKTRNMNKSSDTKNSEGNSTGESNGGNNKSKYSNQKKKIHQSNNNCSSNENSSLKWSYCR